MLCWGHVRLRLCKRPKMRNRFQSRIDQLLPLVSKMTRIDSASVRSFAVIFFCLATSSSASAQISYPMVMSLKPVAIQVGTTTECEVNSRYTMLGTYQVTVEGTGVTAEV